MHKLVLVSLVAAAASQAAGCIISSSSTDEGHITASWTIKSVVTGTDLGCPQGYDTASLYTQAADDNGNPIGTCLTVSDTCFIDRFNCSDGGGVSDPLPAGNYITYLAIEDDAGNAYATSVSALVDITNVDKVFHADLLDDGGYFYLSWNLVGAQSNAQLTCAQAGVTGGVETIATLSGSQSAYNDKFNCEDGADYTAGVPAGNYVVSVDAFDAANQALGAPVNIQKTMRDRNDVQDLGMVNLPIDGL